MVKMVKYTDLDSPQNVGYVKTQEASSNENAWQVATGKSYDWSDSNCL